MQTLQKQFPFSVSAAFFNCFRVYSIWPKFITAPSCYSTKRFQLLLICTNVHKFIEILPISEYEPNRWHFYFVRFYHKLREGIYGQTVTIVDTPFLWSLNTIRLNSCFAMPLLPSIASNLTISLRWRESIVISSILVDFRLQTARWAIAFDWNWTVIKFTSMHERWAMLRDNYARNIWSRFAIKWLNCVLLLTSPGLPGSSRSQAIFKHMINTTRSMLLICVWRARDLHPFDDYEFRTIFYLHILSLFIEYWFHNYYRNICSSFCKFSCYVLRDASHPPQRYIHIYLLISFSLDSNTASLFRQQSIVISQRK